VNIVLGYQLGTSVPYCLCCELSVFCCCASPVRNIPCGTMSHGLSHDLSQPLDSVDPGFELHIAHARILPDPKRICSWEWARHQLHTINWANLALIITVLALSSNIHAQLKQQEAANQHTASNVQTLQYALWEARSVAESLAADLAAARSFNATLHAALALGMFNLTGQIDELRAVVSKRAWARLQTGGASGSVVVPLSSIEQGGSAFQLAPSGYSLIIHQPGVYVIGVHAAQDIVVAAPNYVGGFIVSNGSALAPGAAEGDPSTICAGATSVRRVLWHLPVIAETQGSISTASGLIVVTEHQTPLYLQICLENSRWANPSINPTALWAYTVQ
jgi:hypothetical protein